MISSIVLSPVKLDCDPHQRTTKEGSEYFTFKVSSVKPDKNGYFFKFDCTMWSTNEIKRLKLHRGSVVTINGNLELKPPKEASGVPEYAIKVNFITYADGYDERYSSPSKPTETAAKTDTDDEERKKLEARKIACGSFLRDLENYNFK